MKKSKPLDNKTREKLEKREKKFGSWWSCETCGEKQPSMEQAEFIKHLEEVHHIKETKGTRSLMMHLDGADWYSYAWSWEIGGLKFVQTTNSKRSKQDAMYWK